jgi:hypothetical protein
MRRQRRHHGICSRRSSNRQGNARYDRRGLLLVSRFDWLVSVRRYLLVLRSRERVNSAECGDGCRKEPDMDTARHSHELLRAGRMAVRAATKGANADAIYVGLRGPNRLQVPYHLAAPALTDLRGQVQIYFIFGSHSSDGMLLSASEYPRTTLTTRIAGNPQDRAIIHCSCRRFITVCSANDGFVRHLVRARRRFGKMVRAQPVKDGRERPNGPHGEAGADDPQSKPKTGFAHPTLKNASPALASLRSNRAAIRTTRRRSGSAAWQSGFRT